MTDGQLMALGIIVAIVLIKWALPSASGPSKVQRLLVAAWNSPGNTPGTAIPAVPLAPPGEAPPEEAAPEPAPVVPEVPIP